VVVVDVDRLSGLDAATGDRRWRESFESGELDPLVVLGDGVVYLAAEGEQVDGFDARTGVSTFHFVSSARANDVAVTDRRIFVASSDGAVYGVA
jgi:outer membrane protein assembly factor BamB